jgi:hypothetical protein
VAQCTHLPHSPWLDNPNALQDSITKSTAAVQPCNLLPIAEHLLTSTVTFRLWLADFVCENLTSAEPDWSADLATQLRLPMINQGQDISKYWR